MLFLRTDAAVRKARLHRGIERMARRERSGTAALGLLRQPSLDEGTVEAMAPRVIVRERSALGYRKESPEQEEGPLPGRGAQATAHDAA